MSSTAAPYPSSKMAKRTVNPIRGIVDALNIVPNPEKSMIPLSIGDPTKFGNFKTPKVFVDALVRNVHSFEYNGYGHSAGLPATRAAIAKRFSVKSAPLTADDVIVASGCSGSLEIVIKALASEGENILIPRPGFSLYKTLALSNGIEVKEYPLLPEKNWQVDIDAMEDLIDGNTRAILVNNPSNPCGAVYSEQHLKDILAVAQRKNLPIIADEIYGEMTFGDNKFFPMASLTSNVPVLSTGGIAKCFLVPGWRVGWILIHDRNGLLSEVRKGLISLTQLIVGANTLVQSAIPSILDPAEEDAASIETFHADTLAQLEGNASIVYERLKKIEGLTPITPQGAMYVMVKVNVEMFGDDIDSDMAFSQKLLDDESVFVLPGQCFGAPNFFRVVFCATAEMLNEACDRIEAFCEKKRLKENGTTNKRQRTE